MQKYKTAKGTRDSDPKTEYLKQKLLEECETMFKLYNAQRMDTPIIELYDLLVNSNSSSNSKETGKTQDKEIQETQDTEIQTVEKEIFTLNNKNTDGEKTALRFDLTVPFSRYVQTNQIKNMKRYQIGKVFRRDQPSANRYREFLQCDYDYLGNNNETFTDIETLTLLQSILQKFKTKFNLPEYTILINSRKLLNNIFKLCDISSTSENNENICRILDKLDKITWKIAQQELLKYISKSSTDKLYQFINVNQLNTEEINNQINTEELNTQLNNLDEYKKLRNILERVENTEIDLSLARGLQYYTGLVFEVKIRDVNVSIAGGGRYDKMMNIPCIGFSLGIDRIINYTSTQMESVKVWIAAIQRETKQKEIKQTEEDIPNKLQQEIQEDKIQNYKLSILKELRNNNISCDTTFKTLPIKKSIQYANNNNINFIIFVGTTELETETVTIKNLKTKTQNNLKLTDLLTYFK